MEFDEWLFEHHGKNINHFSRKHQEWVVDEIPTEHQSHESLQTPSQQYNTRWMVLIVSATLSILLMRSAWLQLVEGSTYRSAAEGNRIHTTITTAIRGVITDRDQNLLVQNKPSFRVLVHGDRLQDRSTATLTAFSSAVSEGLDVEQKYIVEAVQRAWTSGHAQILIDPLSYDDALRAIVQMQQFPAIEVQTYYTRQYTSGPLFAHILGYTGSITEEEYKSKQDQQYQFDDFIGKTGIEYSYESELRGIDGYNEREVDNKGREQQVVSDTPAQPGLNLQLTVDAGLQQTLYAQLERVVEEQHLPGAAAVAIDPRSGAIRALVSYPSYDNNIFSQTQQTQDYQRIVTDERHPLFNRAISGLYPSGSTFKPVIAAAGLEEKIISPSTTVNSVGGVQIDQFFFPDWKAGGHGVTNVIKALAESVNTFFYLLGGGDNTTTTGLGVERIEQYATLFGFGRLLNIDLPGEEEGFLPSKEWKEEFKNEPWYIGDTYHLAIGQGDILVTPLQIASMTATVANGGTLYQPYVVEKLSDQLGNSVQTHQPTILHEQVVSDVSIRTVQAGLREAVLSGSARSLQLLPVSSAGKTGTAQFGSGELTHSWFTAYAPFDEPEIALTVIVESAGGGNDAAVPIVREVLLEYFNQ